MQTALPHHHNHRHEADVVIANPKTNGATTVSNIAPSSKPPPPGMVKDGEAPIGAVTTGWWPTAVPQRSHYHASTGRVHALVRRQRGGLVAGRKVRVTMALQSSLVVARGCPASGSPPPDPSKHMDTVTNVFLIAEKLPGSTNFAIFSPDRMTVNHTADPPATTTTTATSSSGVSITKWGEVYSVHNSSKGIIYVLVDQDHVQLANILYQVPSLRQVVTEGPPRRVRVLLPAVPHSNVPSSLEDETATPSTKGTATSHLGKRSWDEATGPSSERVHVFHSKDAKTKVDGTMALNFKGRGRMASSKNMQLVDHQGRVVCQMVKWDEEMFHVDFREPFTALQAFAFALAQLDL